MIKLALHLLILLVLKSININAQHPNINDSIFDKYVTHGAYNYMIYSHEWQHYLDSALAITPNNGNLWQLKSMPYFKCGKYDVGIQYINKAVDLSPHDYLDYRAFLICVFVKNYNLALKDFIKVKQLKEGAYIMDHSYDFYIGLCYLQLNNFSNAEQYFNMSMSKTKSPHYLELFYHAIVLYEKQQYNQAIIEFNNCLKFYSNFSDAKYYKACCLQKGNK
jgi:tetratricopeptide (TPR) repeat protein